jgi:hypothetical protein
MIVAESTNTATRFIKTETQTEFDFGKTYQLYWKLIFRIAYHHLRVKDLAENIVVKDKTPIRTDNPNQTTKAHDFKN